jgi:thiamine biosynthesis lipoprotein
VRLGQACGLDLGGIAKGWTVDRAAELLRPLGSFAVDAGGDLRAHGVQADGSRWTVGVQDPFQPDRDLLLLAIDDCAVVTSSTLRRRWRMGSAEHHHLIDPRTGVPAASGVAAVSVVATSAAWAEVLAKAALLLGREQGLAFIDAQPNMEAVLVLTDRTFIMTDGLRLCRTEERRCELVPGNPGAVCSDSSRS